ncbi:VOC family protein [Marivita sp. S2033]|uniref:VOC family protein n=1 Tax=Marivita sp. S2033 TaxID=3373187 RepID=UPI0039823438
MKEQNVFVLDHIAVAGETLEAAVAYSETVLGMPLGAGGQHAHYATHNRLLGLADGLYLEAIARDPSQRAPDYPRWFGLDRFAGPPRLDKWILRCADIAAARRAFSEAGAPVHLTRGGLRWTMLVPADGELPFDGLFPAILQWHTDTPPGLALPARDARLLRLTLSHPDAASLKARLAGVLDDPRVAFAAADHPSLAAEIATPQGVRTLSRDDG